MTGPDPECAELIVNACFNFEMSCYAVANDGPPPPAICDVVKGRLREQMASVFGNRPASAILTWGDVKLFLEGSMDRCWSLLSGYEEFLS